MPTYRLLFFRSNRLERWEELEAESDLDAVQMAAQRQSDDIMELWSSGRKIGVFRPYARSGQFPKGRRQERKPVSRRAQSD